MADLFTRRRDTESCPLTKQNHLGKCNIKKLCHSNLVNNGTLKSIADFASALSNVKMLIMFKMLKYLICLVSCNNVVFLPFLSPENHLRQRPTLLESRKVMKNIHGGNSFLITLKSFWQKFLSIFASNFTKT